MSASPPETRASLIRRLQDATDAAAWDEFADIYSPVVFRCARRLGLQTADAEDCVQEVLTAVAHSVCSWLQRSDRGSFRRWLFRIARNTSIDYLTRRKFRVWSEGGEEAAARLNEMPDDCSVSSQFDLEYRREVFLRSSEVVRQQVSESTWQAFYRTSVLSHDIAQVASDLECSPGSIYIARSRVMKRLQRQVKSFLEGNHDPM